MVLSSSLNLSDRDNTTIESASVSISNNLNVAEDRLGFTDDPNDNISGVYDNAKGVFTLNGTTASRTTELLLNQSHNNISENQFGPTHHFRWG